MKPVGMMSLKITWFGHAAFLLETETVRVMLDPYRTPDVGGYAPINAPADIVLVSHLNPKEPKLLPCCSPMGFGGKTVKFRLEPLLKYLERPFSALKAAVESEKLIR